EAIGTPNDLPFAKKAFLSGRSVISNHPEDSLLQTGGPVRQNLLCVPFSHGRTRGVLTLFDRRGGSGPLFFSRLERETVRALLRVGVLSLQHIVNETEIRNMSRSLEWRVRELTLLHHISRAVLDRNEVHEVLRSLLEAVTNLVGFGFNRAFLFMKDPGENVLRGVMGVEALPVAASEAGMAGPVGPYAVPHRNLDHRVSSLHLPVQAGGGVLSRAVLERRPFRIRMPGDRELLGSELIRQIGDIQSFAVAPLLSGETVLGVIWADNFKTMRPIRSDDFRLLVTAAAQAALAIERSARAEALDMLNRKLLNLQNQLIQWEKLAALGEMAASVAHDIRNPLVSIGGFARRLKKLMPGNEKGEKYAQIIIQEVDRLEWTLENVMSYARSYGMIEKKPARLYGLLSECAELFTENFRKKRIDFKRCFEEGIPEIVLDERQIKQALINILFNAGESVAEGGVVIVSARVENGGGEGYAVIEISDNGGGIASEDVEKIFLPFFTTKASGTGLGLAIAHRAISGHGGEIRVDNRPGEGVTFRIYLPLLPVERMEA
ncbi:MAG: GAF domain-containing protein, partial [Proteobacteria bacterium]|nr:GAF domain-containing protein [Pseudomonadota bacterium]